MQLGLMVEMADAITDSSLVTTEFTVAVSFASSAGGEGGAQKPQVWVQ